MGDGRCEGSRVFVGAQCRLNGGCVGFYRRGVMMMHGRGEKICQILCSFSRRSATCTGNRKDALEQGKENP